MSRKRIIYRTFKRFTIDAVSKIVEVLVLLIMLSVIFGVVGVYFYYVFKIEELMWMHTGAFIFALAQAIVNRFREIYEKERDLIEKR